jgi:PAS domain S-box-containing protein
VTYVNTILLLLVAILGVVVAVLLIQRARQSRDTQGIRESEARLRLMVDGSPVMMWTARPDTTHDFLNATVTEFTGLPLAQLLDNGWMAAVHPEDRDTIYRIYMPAVEARRPFTLEYRLRRADGAYRWILDTGVPNHAVDGTFVGYVGSCLDITERHDAENRIRGSRAALEVSHREIQQLAGRLITVHEDERRRLARDLHDDLTQRLARLAIDAGKRERGGSGDCDAWGAMRSELARLSEDVHALAYRLHPSVLDDLGLVEALRTECDRVARHGALRVDVEADAPDTVPAETSLCLFRVAQEALANALRHARASVVTVLLAPSGSGLKLAISDNGKGFDPAQPREHTSLGLASMRERVRVACGELAIDSKPGRGTTVVAWVPA